MNALAFELVKDHQKLDRSLEFQRQVQTFPGQQCSQNIMTSQVRNGKLAATPENVQQDTSSSTAHGQPQPWHSNSPRIQQQPTGTATVH